MNKESATHLASLHPQYGIENVDIRPLVEGVRRGGPGFLPSDLDPKTRRNVLSAIFIERMWRLVEQAEQDSPETLGLPSETMRVLESRSMTNDLGFLLTNVEQTTCQHLQAMGACEAEKPDPLTDELKNTIYEDDHGRTQVTYPGRIDLGISNALKMSWQSMRIIPYMVEDKSLLTPEHYRALCLRNISVLRNLAKAHLSVFSSVHANTSWTKFPGFSPDTMRFVGEGNTQRVDYQTFVMGEVEMHRHNIKGSIATFCPALFAKASDGKDVVMALYEWCMRIGDRVLFPHIQAILGRTHMVSELQMMIEDVEQITVPGTAEIVKMLKALKK